jgi:hypothetical protein
VKNREGEDLNRSVGLADRGKPRECQHSPGMLSAWQGADACNPACADIVELGFKQRTDFRGLGDALDRSRRDKEGQVSVGPLDDPRATLRLESFSEFLTGTVPAADLREPLPLDS